MITLLTLVAIVVLVRAFVAMVRPPSNLAKYICPTCTTEFVVPYQGTHADCPNCSHLFDESTFNG